MATAITKEWDAYMRKAPFFWEMNALMAELDRTGKYASADDIVGSDEFRTRMDAIVERTPGVRPWLYEMP